MSFNFTIPRKIIRRMSTRYCVNPITFLAMVLGKTSSLVTYTSVCQVFITSLGKMVCFIIFLSYFVLEVGHINSYERKKNKKLSTQKTKTKKKDNLNTLDVSKSSATRISL